MFIENLSVQRKWRVPWIEHILSIELASIQENIMMKGACKYILLDMM